MEKIIFAAGCFWHIEDEFRRTEGVTSTRVGYTGGQTSGPDYNDVCSGLTGHAEAVEVGYDLNRISLDQLLDVFWGIHDPTQINAQGPDVGSQYRSAIFCFSEDQKKSALKSKDQLIASGRLRAPVATEITSVTEFYPAEDYHQMYMAKQRGDYP